MTGTLQEMRSEYAGKPLSDDAVDADPLRQFDIWFQEAIAAEIPDANAMVLSTVDSGSQPSSRVVLLKGVEKGGFVFYTNYASRKGRELAANEHASLLFFWQPLARQVRIDGRITRVSKESSQAYFASRPRDSQIAAWASSQSEIISSRQELERAFEAARTKFGDGPIPLPDTWGGYLLTPVSVEFWQGRPNRLHDRIAYRHSGTVWDRSRLAP